MEEHHTDAGKSQKSSTGDMPPAQETRIMDEAVTVSAIVTKLQYKTYVCSLVRLLVGEQLQLKWVKRGMKCMTTIIIVRITICGVQTWCDLLEVG